MRILISGGFYSFGLTLAEKLLKEGHDVTLIDNLSDSGSTGISEKHIKFYNLSSSDTQCEKIFSAGRFELVIFIPKYNFTSIKSEKKVSADEDILQGCIVSGLVNMLDLSTRHNVKKFVLISSSEIYGNTGEKLLTEDEKPNPVTLKGMSSYVMEFYCFRWGEINNISILSLRISDFYGPGSVSDLSYTEQDLISKVLYKLLNNEEVKIKALENQLLDLLYIDDLVDGISQTVLNLKCIGVYNLSGGKAISINSIIEAISSFKLPIKFIIDPVLSEINIISAIDNTKILKNTEWKPKTELIDGLKQTFEYIKSRVAKRKKLKVKASKSLKKKSFKIVAYLENIVLFLLAAFVQWGNLFFRFRLPDLKIDYSIIYIIIMGILWGQTQAYIAMILSALLFIGMNLYSGVDIVTFIYSPENLIRLALYILVGIITGYSIERKNREIESKTLMIDNIQNKYSFLTNIYNETRIVKDELESRIIETEDSFSAIYKIIQEVDSLEIEKVFSGAISAIERIMKTSQVSIYTLSDEGKNNFMRLKARSLLLADKVPNSIKISDFLEISNAIKTKSIFINREFKPDIPVLIAPVIDDKKVIALISIHNTAFENLTLHYENLFQTVLSLIMDALKRAYYFEASLKDKRYLPQTRILTPYTFEKILNEIRNNKKELGMSYTLLKIQKDETPLESVSERAARTIRDNDYIGIDNSGIIYILLSNTKNNYANLVLERLKKVKINVELVSEDIEDE